MVATAGASELLLVAPSAPASVIAFVFLFSSTTLQGYNTGLHHPYVQPVFLQLVAHGWWYDLRIPLNWLNGVLIYHARPNRAKKTQNKKNWIVMPSLYKCALLRKSSRKQFERPRHECNQIMLVGTVSEICSLLRGTFLQENAIITACLALLNNFGTWINVALNLQFSLWIKKQSKVQVHVAPHRQLESLKHRTLSRS